MEFENKLKMLDRIYEVYDTHASMQNSVCAKYCADCCTCNVTLTSLEAYRIVRHLTIGNKMDSLSRLVALNGKKRFHPTITTNRLAELCMRDEEIPSEEIDPAWGRCPFLLEEACCIYPVRPLGCRCLLSRRKCGFAGAAEMTPLMLTVNSVFMQIMEHLDREGVSGNLTDLVLWLASEENRQEYESQNPSQKGTGFISNRPLPCLLIPQEHRREMEKILAELKGIIVYIR